MATSPRFDLNGNNHFTQSVQIKSSASSSSIRRRQSKDNNDDDDKKTATKSLALVEKSKSSTTTTTTNNNINTKLDVDSQFLLYNKINTKKKITLTHQFFTLSLLEYICNLLSPNDRNSAEAQFQG